MIIKKDIIDNNDITMQSILNSEIPSVASMDVSTGYFDVGGYGLLKESLEKASENKSFTMRLLLGREAIMPKEGSFEKYAEQYNITQKESSIKSSLDGTELSTKSLDDTTSLINFLEKGNIHVRMGKDRFNHAKCYIMGKNSVFVGSSNFTVGGMTRNYELNAGLYQPNAVELTKKWFDHMWDSATDERKHLIDVLLRSKFGTPPTPYEVYMKMLFERYRPLLENIEQDLKESKNLTKFQRDAVRMGLFIVSEFGGVIISDATGLGKTNMGIEIVRQKVLKEGKKVMLIAPSQVLHSMWKEKLKEVDINIREKLTMESLGKEDMVSELEKYKKIDLIIIDESQNFRSKSANRRKNLMKLRNMGKQKQVILLTATPINNSLMDLYYQLSIITGGVDHYFYRTIGIRDLYQHMREATNKDLSAGLEKIQQLLDAVMVRRTRSYIKKTYPDDKINGKPLSFPKHEYSTIKYSLSELFGNIFEKILEDMGKLEMAPYGLQRYDNSLKKEEQEQYHNLAHLQIIILLKRFESSTEAIKISLSNKINLYKYVKKVLEEGKLLHVDDFNKILSQWNTLEMGNEIEESDDDEETKIKFFMEKIEGVEKDNIGEKFDVELFKKDLEMDLNILKGLQREVEKVTIDTKLEEVSKTIMREQALNKESKKVLIFTEYAATARYITRELKKKFPNNIIECITGNSCKDTRIKYIRRFAPKANLGEEENLNSEEIDILISTEVLSEGQNLQDCNYVINYDLPWNPMRIVQRTGRIDRLTNIHDTIHTRACYPDAQLDEILNLVGKLINKIHVVDDVIGGDSEILGETPTPKQFNGTDIDRIKILSNGGSEKLIEKMEEESNMMPASTPINELSKFIKEKGMEIVSDIPIGRRSGKFGEGQYVILSHLQEKPERRVYFTQYDFKGDKVYVPEGDDSDIIRLASCMPDTVSYLPMDGEEHRESFELLLNIDKKAKEAIKDSNNRVRKYVKELQTKRRTQHDKNVEFVENLIIDKSITGEISREEAKKIIKIISSEYMIQWADNLNDIILKYKRENDINDLIKIIKKMGDWIGIEEKIQPIKKLEEEQLKNPELKLVGAMFVTGAKFNEFGLNKFTKK